MPAPRTEAPGRVDERTDTACPPAFGGGAPQAGSPEGSGGRGDVVCDSYRLQVAVDGNVLDEGYGFVN